MEYKAIDDHDHAGVADNKLLGNIAEMLSVTQDNLKTALCSRVIAAGGQVVEKQLTVSDAVYARDAFAKVIFISFSFLFWHKVILLFDFFCSTRSISLFEKYFVAQVSFLWPPPPFPLEKGAYCRLIGL